MTTPGRGAWLCRPIQTKLGQYQPGLAVIALRVTQAGVDVCMDNGHHPAGVCHAETLNHHDLILEDEIDHPTETSTGKAGPARYRAGTDLPPAAL